MVKIVEEIKTHAKPQIGNKNGHKERLQKIYQQIHAQEVFQKSTYRPSVKVSLPFKKIKNSTRRDYLVKKKKQQQKRTPFTSTCSIDSS